MNRRYPRYPDDADYQTNAPSYYEDLARLQKLFEILSKRIWDYDREIAEYFKRWEENLKNINHEVIKMMIDWLDTGILEDILNNELLNHKPEIYVSIEEPETEFYNVYWYQDVGDSGLQTNIFKTNVKVSDHEPEDEYNVWLNY